MNETMIPTESLDRAIDLLLDALIAAMPYRIDDPDLDFDDDPATILAYCILDADFEIDDADAANSIALALFELTDSLDLDAEMLAARLTDAHNRSTP